LSLPKALVDYLNSLRKENGIPSVNYANSGTSNLRARYMLDHNLFSHYDLEGVHPGYYFTKTSNYYGGEESIGMTFYGRPVLRDGVQVMREAKRILYRMLYEDEESNWGHRDSLLDPCFNYSDISVAWDSRRIFVVVTMISAWVDWVLTPRLQGNVFKMRGKVRVMSPTHVLVLRDEPHPGNVSRRFYTLGEVVAGVSPQGIYQGIETIRPTRWELGRNLDVEFPLDLERGLTTVLVLGRDPRGISWSPLGQRRPGECKLLTYTLRT
jgi:hypothetical protein